MVTSNITEDTPPPRSSTKIGYSPLKGIGAPILTCFAARWPAYAYPCQRFAPGLAADHA
jgi:hypothetical protein